MTSVPTLALVAWPVTWLAGAIVSYNVLTLSAPALAGWTAFLLARRLTADAAAAWVCGFLFGFSSYEKGHLLGHLNLDTVFLVPVLLHLPLRRLAAELTQRQHIGRLGIAMLFQLGISTEVFATSCLFGALTWAVFLLTSLRDKRIALLALAYEVAMAAILATPLLYYVTVGAAALPETINSARTYSANLLNLVVPTQLTWLGGHMFPGVEKRFSGATAEQGAYLGLPLLLALVLFYAGYWRRRQVRALLLVTLCLLLCTLGPALWLDGRTMRMPLPWALAEHVPLIRSALPGRFTLYMSLAVGLAVALWLGAANNPLVRARRFALGAASCIALIPDPRAFQWISVPVQPVFTSEATPTTASLTLPFGAAAYGMVWQWQSGFRFPQTAGYLGFTPPAEDDSILGSLQSGEPEQDFLPRFIDYAVRHKLRTVIAGPGTPTALIGQFTAAGWPRTDHGAVGLFTVPDLMNAPRYAIRGQYWSEQQAGWLGRGVTIATHGMAVRVTLDAQHPDGLVTTVKLALDGAETYYTLQPGQQASFDVPSTGTANLTASPLFMPNRFLHNRDDRLLSVRMAVQAIP